jgi:CheY-like chemotaxis protein
MDETFNLKPNDLKEGKEKLSKRILLAEDYTSARESYVRLLTRRGYTVDAVENGQLLLDKLTDEKGKYDLVITDNTMPKITGIEALQQIRQNERFRNLPVIVNSGDVGDTIRKAVESLGGIYIMKGGPTEVFLKTIVEAISVSSE